MKVNEIINEAANAAQQAAIAISMKKAGKKPKNESVELEEEFDLIESIIERLAAHNGVDAEAIWEDLETLTEDELYAFAVTSEPIMESQGMAEGLDSEKKQRLKDLIDQYRDATDPEAYYGLNDEYPDAEEVIAQIRQEFGNRTADSVEQGPSMHYPRPGHSRGYDPMQYKSSPRITKSGVLNKQDVGSMKRDIKQRLKQGVAEDWQKANQRDRTAGMSQKAVNAYRRENPGSKLKTAVTTKPSKLKKGGKASKRRKSYCSRSRGQMKMHSISCAKTPDKAICKARRRWNC